MIYVLKLENNKWYVGKTRCLKRRLKEHFSGRGAKWTQLHAPLECVEISFIIDEKTMTLNYMKKYGWENVRGYCWCARNLNKCPSIINY